MRLFGTDTGHAIVISGGEPLMRKDLADVGKALKSRGYPWGMVTNGLALTEERFNELIAFLVGLGKRLPAIQRPLVDEKIRTLQRLQGVEFL